MSEQMTRRERVMAAVNGEAVDRVPVCFWHHFRPEGSGRKLARATQQFFDQQFNLDIAKIMPDLPYPFPRGGIRQRSDWYLVEPLDLDRTRFIHQRAEAVQVLREQVGPDTPIVMTVFSPLTEAIHFCESKEAFLQFARTSPAPVHEALAILAANLRAHIGDVISAGADGVFLALQGCSTDFMSEAEYREFGRPYDLLALGGAVDGWLNILHIHGDRNLMFDAMLDYPVSVLSWSDRLAGPTLREARAVSSKCLMGGWHEFGPLSNGPEDAIRAEAEDAIRQTGGRKFILANGCSVPDDTDERWLQAARDIAGSLTTA
ncbi:MAG: uroporphyrinogen decarboxylase [Chloroflexota bacterium]|nr:uroporphyrinogen decarboxylase [Chloroflexota bacterium]